MMFLFAAYAAGSIKFLYAAYAATWIIHLLYILHLRSRYNRLRDEVKELEKE